MEQDKRAEYAESIDAEKVIFISGGIGEVKIQLHIGSSRLHDLVSDHQYRTGSPTTSGQLIEHILRRKWLDKLRHEHTNYELILGSHLPNAGDLREQAHAQIKEQVNDFLAEAWKVFALAYCQKLEIAWCEYLVKQNEAIQKSAERFQKERLQQEQKCETERREVIWQQEENLLNTRYAFTRAEVARVLPSAPLKTPMWGPILRRELEVIQTYALCSKDMNYYMCAVVSDSCDWLNFNASGCLEYATNYEKKQFRTIETLTVAKISSKLGNNLSSSRSLGDIVSIGNTPMLIVCVGGGRFSNQIDWEAQQELFKQKQAAAQEQRTIAEAERLRLETEHFLAVAEEEKRLKEKRLGEEGLRVEQTGEQCQQKPAEGQTWLPVKTTIPYPVIDLNAIEAERLRVEAERTRLNSEDTERSRTNLRRILKEPESRGNPEKQKYSQEQLARQEEALEALYERNRFRAEQNRKAQDTKDAQNKQTQLKQKQETRLAPAQRQVFGPGDFRNEGQEKRPAQTPSGGGCVVLLLALGMSTILVSKYSTLLFQWVALLLHKAF